MPNWKKLIVSGSDASLNSLIAPSITGSLNGNADTATTASYALNIGELSGFNHTQSIASTTWTIEHNLGTQLPIVTVYDSNYEVIIPNSIINQDANTTTVGFTYSTTGYATVSSGDGISRNNIGLSKYSSTASYIETAQTASYFHTASVSTASYVEMAQTASYVDIVGENLTVNYNGSQIQLTASAVQTLQDVTTAGNTTTSSVAFGNDIQVTGSVDITGNFYINGAPLSTVYSGMPIKTTVYNFSDLNMTTNGYAGTSYLFNAIYYTPMYADSKLEVYFDNSYVIDGWGSDSWLSQLIVSSTIVDYKKQYWRNERGGGTRGNTLFPLSGYYQVSSLNNIAFRVRIINNGADDTLTNQGYALLKITEIKG